MMYSEQTLASERVDIRRPFSYFYLFIGLGAVGLILGLIVRNRALTLLSAILGAMLAFFVFDVWCAPRRKYIKFLKSMLGGRSHEVSGSVLQVDKRSDHMSEDGVRVYNITIQTDDRDQGSLFYWDARFPLPDVQLGDTVDLVVYGRYVKQMEKRQ